MFYGSYWSRPPNVHTARRDKIDSGLNEKFRKPARRNEKIAGIGTGQKCFSKDVDKKLGACLVDWRIDRGEHDRFPQAPNESIRLPKFFEEFYRRVRSGIPDCGTMDGNPQPRRSAFFFEREKIRLPYGAQQVHRGLPLILKFKAGSACPRFVEIQREPPALELLERSDRFEICERCAIATDEE